MSFESLVPAGTELLEAEELPEEESKVHQLKMVPLRKIPVKMAEEVDEKEFILGTTVGGKLLPGVVEQTRWARGEAEMNYLQELVNDVNALVALSGRVDVLVQHSIQFEVISFLYFYKKRFFLEKSSANFKDDSAKEAVL